MSILNHPDTKTKAFVVFLFSMMSIALFILSALFANAVFQELYGLIVGIALMIAAIPFHRMGKSHKLGYLLSFLINSVANGFSVSAYFFSSGIKLNLYEMLISALPAAGILLLVYLMLRVFHSTKKTTMTAAAIINGVVTIVLLVLWITRGSLIFSFGFFCSLISIFYLCVFGITIDHDKRPVLRDISFGSFGSCIIITVVVIFILFEGEMLEGLDLDIGGSRKNKRKR